MPGSFHLSFIVIFGDEVTKISCHFQAKTVQLFFLFFVIYEKRKWNKTLIKQHFLYQAVDWKIRKKKKVGEINNAMILKVNVLSYIDDQGIIKNKRPKR